MKKFNLLFLSIILCGCAQNGTSTSIISNCTSINNLSSSNSNLDENSSNNNTSISSESSLSVSNSLLVDPYENMTKEQFYSNYQETTSYEDAMLRTEHGLISGSIDYISEVPQKETLYSGENFIKFNNYSYGYNTNNEIISYNINTKDGIYKTIYYNAGYVVLEEVAAYILAFGEVPPNNNYHKNKGKDESIAKWGEYGRVNVGDYSNNIIKYPEEPELPTHDSNGKAYQYIETDLGLDEYNNGYSITRGTYRIVFTGEYQDGTKVTDINERHVFYTYNHYYDFEEYLNYYGGWGDRFGYETGNNVNPTSYIEAIIVDKNTLS